MFSFRLPPACSIIFHPSSTIKLKQQQDFRIVLFFLQPHALGFTIFRFFLQLPAASSKKVFITTPSNSSFNRFPSTGVGNGCGSRQPGVEPLVRHGTLRDAHRRARARGVFRAGTVGGNPGEEILPSSRDVQVSLTFSHLKHFFLFGGGVRTMDIFPVFF